MGTGETLRILPGTIVLVASFQDDVMNQTATWYDGTVYLRPGKAVTKQDIDNTRQVTDMTQLHALIDDYTKDISGAKAVGMKTVFYNEKQVAGVFPDADRSVVSMQELPGIIEEIQMNY